MVKSVYITGPGGSDVMQFTDIELTPPGTGEVRVRHSAIGINFIDTYHRSGLYPLSYPSGLGLEAAGVIEDVGEGVSDFKKGDRVAYGTGPIGAYCESRNMPCNRLIKLPDSISDETAAGMMLKGMTVRYLFHVTKALKSGDTILFHAAAGGVGLIACQWAKALGVTMIGTVGSQEKAELARAHGCQHIINYREQDVAKQVRELTNGKGVPVVYDGVGQATLMGSIDSLSPRGLLVSYGNASGPIKNLDTGLLNTKGSLFFTRPTLFHHIATDEDFAATTADLLDMVGSAKVKIPVNQRYKLDEIATVHEDLESRKTTGTTIVTP